MHTNGLAELASLIAQTSGTKKARLEIAIDGGGGNCMFSVRNQRGQPIVTTRSAPLSYDLTLDDMARWTFEALAGKALGLDT